MDESRARAFLLETKATPEQVRQREQLYELFRARPMPDDELFISLGLFLRSSALAKLLFLDESYRLIKEIPGSILEFGTWRGQNLVVYENLRAIYEPFNATRRIIGFDTFSGYTALSENDRSGRTVAEGAYALEGDYPAWLNQLLAYHERDNVLGTSGKHEIVQGNVIDSVPQYLNDHPELQIALAYFDLALYEPTKICLEALWPRLMPGSVLMMDELGWRDYPGETVAFREILSGQHYRLQKSRFMTDRTFVILE